MTRPDLGTAHWRRSSYSGARSGDCVEVGVGHQWVVPVRDSMAPDRPRVVFVKEQWSAFLDALRSGSLRH